MQRSSSRTHNLGSWCSLLTKPGDRFEGRAGRVTHCVFSYKVFLLLVFSGPFHVIDDVVAYSSRLFDLTEHCTALRSGIAGVISLISWAVRCAYSSSTASWTLHLGGRVCTVQRQNGDLQPQARYASSFSTLPPHLPRPVRHFSFVCRCGIPSLPVQECIVLVALFLVAGLFMALVSLRDEDLCERGFWYGYGYGFVLS